MSTPEIRQEIEQEIEQTRARLGATVEELAAKADVKARARGKAAEVKANAQARAAEVKAELTALPGRARRSQRRWPLAVAAGRRGRRRGGPSGGGARPDRGRCTTARSVRSSIMPNGLWYHGPASSPNSPVQGVPRPISMPPESNASSDCAQVRSGQW
jgi:hypothetical protein